MNVRLIMNPGSRSGRGRRLWDAWESGLRRSGVDFDRVVTTGMGEAFMASRDSRDVDTVVAVGGDGTINEVLDGLVQSGDLRRRMGVLYSGTSPDFCRFHSIPTEPRAALACLVAGMARPVDVVRVRYADGGGNRRMAHFGCSCNIGLGAAVARFANRWRRALGDGLGTGLAVVRAIVCTGPVDLELEVDGEKIALPCVNNLSVLKNPYLASGLRLNVGLRPDDGRLVLAAVHGRSRVGLCALLPGFYSGRAASSGTMLMKPCARVIVRSSVAADMEFDGDPHGFLPAEIEIMPRVLNLIGASDERV